MSRLDILPEYYYVPAPNKLRKLERELTGDPYAESPARPTDQRIVVNYEGKAVAYFWDNPLFDEAVISYQKEHYPELTNPIGYHYWDFSPCLVWKHK